MNQPPEDPDLAGSSDENALAVSREQIAERLRFIFRQAGNNPPAVELEQQIMTYRLTERPQ